MAQNKIVTLGPVALSSTLTTNIFNPGTTTGGVLCTTAPNDKLYAIIKHIRVTNKTTGAVTFSLWKGATAGNVAGTEFVGTGLSVAANSSYDWYGMARFDTIDFLVGGASAGTSLTFQAEAEIGIA